MSFAQAVLGRLTLSSVTSAIQSQAETELGRSLNEDELSSLFSRSTPNAVLDQIQQVKINNIHFIKNLVLILS